MFPLAAIRKPARGRWLSTTISEVAAGRAWTKKNAVFIWIRARASDFHRSQAPWLAFACRGTFIYCDLNKIISQPSAGWRLTPACETPAKLESSRSQTNDSAFAVLIVPLSRAGGLQPAVQDVLHTRPMPVRGDFLFGRTGNLEKPRAGSFHNDRSNRQIRL